MGAEPVNMAVVDAGPLIHLAEIQALALLHIFDKLYIPDVVWSETVGRGRVSQIAAARLTLLQRHTLPASAVLQFITENDFLDLHEGERECLYLCSKAAVSLLLTDDLAVRKAAKSLSLTPIGSLGIVVRAYRQQRISLDEAEKLIADLYDVSSLFVTRAIVELVIEQLRGVAP